MNQHSIWVWEKGWAETTLNQDGSDSQNKPQRVRNNMIEQAYVMPGPIMKCWGFWRAHDASFCLVMWPYEFQELNTNWEYDWELKVKNTWFLAGKMLNILDVFQTEANYFSCFENVVIYFNYVFHVF